MLLQATKAFYYLAQNMAMVLVFAAMFEYRREMNYFHKLVQIMVLTSVQIISSTYIPSFIVPIILVGVFCLISQIDGNLLGRSSVTKAIFVYAIREIALAVSSFAAMMFCYFALQTKGAVIVTAVNVTLLLTVCYCSIPLLRKQSLPEFEKEFSLWFLSSAFGFVLLALAALQAPLGPVNRSLTVGAFIGLLFGGGALLFWVKTGKRFTTLNGIITESTHANHELTRTILGMNQRKAVSIAREMNRTGGFSIEPGSSYPSRADIDAIIGPSIQVDTDTGIHALDVILYEAKERAEKEGINFDCEIGAKLNPLTKRSGITTASLRLILRNLLEMAFDFAITTEREPRVVDCLVSENEGIFRIEIYDSGEAFPPGVLRNLGCRGTPEEDDMAEVLEMLARCDASLFIFEEEEPTATGTARHIMVQFDGAGELKVTSPHAGDYHIQIKKALERKKRGKESLYVPNR